MDGNTKVVWICGQWNGPHSPWDFQGVFDTEDQAIAACKDYTHFIAPATVNQSVPRDPIEWPGLRYPISPSPVESLDAD